MCARQDMRISNIMEHRGDMPYIPKGFKDDKKKKKKNEKPVMLLRGVHSAANLHRMLQYPAYVSM